MKNLNAILLLIAISISVAYACTTTFITGPDGKQITCITCGNNVSCF